MNTAGKSKADLMVGDIQKSYGSENYRVAVDMPAVVPADVDQVKGLIEKTLRSAGYRFGVPTPEQTAAGLEFTISTHSGGIDLFMKELVKKISATMQTPGITVRHQIAPKAVQEGKDDIAH